MRRQGRTPLPSETATPTAIASIRPTLALTSTPERPPGTPYVPPGPQPIAVADDEVWREIAAETAGRLTPLLRPWSLPAGLQTVTSDIRQRGRPGDGAHFLVDYRGAATRVRLMAGILNPAPPPITGHQEPVLVRGREAYLTVEDDSQPSRSSWVSWRESGLWRPEGQASGTPFIDYEVIVEGIAPDELLAFVEGLRVWTPE